MKKRILTAAVLLAFGFANAQDSETKSNAFTKGQKFIEGGISIASGDNVSDYFAVTPKMGYMISDKLAIGADLNLSNTKTLTGVDNDSYGAGIFARYYFLKLGNGNLNTYTEAGLGYNHSKSTVNDITDSNNGIKANIDLGINYFFTPHFAATFTLAEIFSYNNANPENGASTDDLVVNINLFNNIFAQPKFGLLYRW